MRRVFSIILIILIVILSFTNLSGCGNNDDNKSNEALQSLTEKAVVATNSTVEETTEEPTEDLEEKYGNINVGDVITLGKTEDGKEIKWLVYSRFATEAYMINVSTIARKSADLYGNCNYISTTLYNWLENDFKNNYFTDNEKNIISGAYFIDDQDYRLYVMEDYAGYFTEPFWFKIDSNSWKAVSTDDMAVWFPENNVLVSSNTYYNGYGGLFWAQKCNGPVDTMSITSKDDEKLTKEEKDFIILSTDEKLKSKYSVEIMLTLSGLKSPS